MLEHSPVGDGGHGIMDLHRRGRDGLAHRHAGDGQSVPVLRRCEQAVDLAAKGKARLLAKAEGARVIIKPLVAQQHGQVGRTPIAGVADDPRHGKILKGMIVLRQAQMAAVILHLG